jgi:FixJ family two-component response regulator
MAFHSQAQRFHLLLTDVVLPDRSGDSLAGELDAARGNLRVIFISGYPENVVAQERFRHPGWSYLAKPFTAAGLLEKVEKALQSELGP